MAPQLTRRPSKFKKRVRQLQSRRPLVIGRKVRSPKVLSAVELQGPTASYTSTVLASARDF